jgi:hypothetical protein
MIVVFATVAFTAIDAARRNDHCHEYFTSNYGAIDAVPKTRGKNIVPI